jgi:D-glycero-beta-D-manno-heptose-7-phosphate kinase
MINKERACELLADFKDKKILVVGDLMLDRYVIGSVNRISPEAPVPVLLVRHENALPGGAANVALNIRALGGRAIIAGVMGKDKPGADLTSLLKGKGIRTDGVLYRNGGRTTVKTRVMAERQQVIRIDHEDSQTGPDGHTPALCRKIRTLIERGVDGVIVEDYGKGVICQAVVDVIMTCAKKKKIPVGYDPKDDRIKIRGLALATPNYKEALTAAGMAEMPLSEPPIRFCARRVKY